MSQGRDFLLEDQLEHKEDWEKIEVRNYQTALEIGIEAVKTGYPLSERLIRQIHEALMKNAQGSAGAAGTYRRVQNFIGPTNQMKDAAYIPPEPQLMDKYMTNLELFINGNSYTQDKPDDLHPLIKAAIIHAQFESTHPFLDGNGRLGRILIVLYLLQSKLIETPYFFLSEELESEKFKYYSLLNGVRGINKPSPDWKSWISFFLDATIKMADHQYSKLHQAEELYQAGVDRLTQPSTKKVWTAMFTAPIADVKQLEKTTGLAPVTIRNALKELVQQNMIFGNDRQRNRRYYFYDLISIMKE